MYDSVHVFKIPVGPDGELRWTWHRRSGEGVDRIIAISGAFTEDRNEAIQMAMRVNGGSFHMTVEPE